METSSLGQRFATAIATKDRNTLASLLAPDIDFVGLTPRKTWPASTPEEILDVVFGHWFEDHEEIKELVEVREGADVVDTHHVGYRLALSTPDGPHLLEQQAYYRDEEGQISYLRVLCSGYRPTD